MMTKNKKARHKPGFLFSAVREGFEPSVQFPVRQFSKLILSASQAPHHICGLVGRYHNKSLFFGTANIAIRLSGQKKISNALVIYPYVVNTHQHLLKNSFNGFNIFKRYSAVFQLFLV